MARGGRKAPVSNGQSYTNAQGAALLQTLHGPSQGEQLLKLVGGGAKAETARQGEALLQLLTGKRAALQVPMRALILRADANGTGLRLVAMPEGYRVAAIGKKPGQSGLEVDDVITSVAGVQLGGLNEKQMAEKWQKAAVDGGELLVCSYLDLYGKEPPRTPARAAAPQREKKPVKTPQQQNKKEIKSKVVGQVEWVVSAKDAAKVGNKVESPKIEIKGLSGFRLVLFPGTAQAPGVDLGRSSSGFSRVVLVPNLTTNMPDKPEPSFWDAFGEKNPSPVPFRLILNGQKSAVLSGPSLWYDFKGLAANAMATLAIEVLDSNAEPETPPKNLRPDSPAFVMEGKAGKSQLRADAPAFTPSLGGRLAAQLSLGIATGLPFVPDLRVTPSGRSGKSGKSKSSGKGSPSGLAGWPDSPSRRFQYQVPSANGTKGQPQPGQNWD